MNHFPDNRAGIAAIESVFGDVPMQPKRTLIEYAGEVGINVPEIFSCLDDALDSGLHIIARSEHPGELYYSGLTDSYTHSPSNPGRRDTAADQLRQLDDTLHDDERTLGSMTKMKQLGRYGFIKAERWRAEASTGEYDRDAADEFARMHSLSYWPAVEGDNIFMVEDSAKAGRFYAGKINRQKEVVVIDNGEITYRASRSNTELAIYDADKLIDFYDSVRDLPFIDNADCPIIELVDPGYECEPVLLQVLPTAPRQKADFEITKPSESVFFVRGATSEEGTEVVFWTGEVDKRKNPLDQKLGAYRFEDEAVEEFYLPETTLFAVSGNNRESSENTLKRFLLAAVDHGTRSQAFKPQVTVGLANEAAAQLIDPTTSRNGKKRCFVKSDGDNAIVKFYDERDRKIVSL
ncbi:MAG TPA: hypothetical protein VF572_04690 [Candidatus Saccharimonadales bacterium]|jgi:hypothetical protein